MVKQLDRVTSLEDMISKVEKIHNRVFTNYKELAVEINKIFNTNIKESDIFELEDPFINACY